MPKIVITRGRTRDNAAHLPAVFLADIEASHGGTRLGRQELDGVLFEDIEYSLWPRAVFERWRTGRVLPSPLQGRRRVRSQPTKAPSMPTPPLLPPLRGSLLSPEGERGFQRIVVGVDPPASAHKRSDACGIVVAAKGADGRFYVLEDASVQGLTPGRWAAAVAATFARWNADRVIVETNQGGNMIAEILRGADEKLPIRDVRARTGKAVRAEPVSAEYERGKVSHCGTFPELEDEMAAMTSAGYEGGTLSSGGSPDRADALVYALGELMKGPGREPRVRGL